jgi:hypothetical protein
MSKQLYYNHNRYNENKPVTTSRDTQEIPPIIGYEMVRMIRDYPYESSILDDFTYYEKKQDELLEYKNYQISNMQNNGNSNMPNLNNMQQMNSQAQSQSMSNSQQPQQKINIIQNPNSSQYSNSSGSIGAGNARQDKSNNELKDEERSNKLTNEDN